MQLFDFPSADAEYLDKLSIHISAPVWLDAGIKSSQKFTQSCPKRSYGRFYFLKVILANIAQTVSKYLDYFWKKIYC